MAAAPSARIFDYKRVARMSREMTSGRTIVCLKRQSVRLRPRAAFQHAYKGWAESLQTSRILSETASTAQQPSSLTGRYTQKVSITLKQIVNRIKCFGQRSGPIDPLISIRFIIRFRLRTIEVFFVIIINIQSIYNTISHSG